MYFIYVVIIVCLYSFYSKESFLVSDIAQYHRLAFDHQTTAGDKPVRSILWFRAIVYSYQNQFVACIQGRTNVLWHINVITNNYNFEQRGIAPTRRSQYERSIFNDEVTYIVTRHQL